jgi:HSP20 family protein
MLMSRNPFSEIEALRREIDRAFEGFGGRPGRFASGAFLPGRGARQYPLVNLYEEKDAVYVEALAPGINPEELNVSVMHNVLTISGEKKDPIADVKPEAFHRRERAVGKFVRQVELPIDVDAEKVSAAYKNGLLRITLPKSEAAKPRQIAVQSS